MTPSCQGTDPLGHGKGPDFWQHVADTMCPGCPVRAACLQSAADAPFDPVGPWAGLVLPRDLDILRRTTTPRETPTYDITSYHEITTRNPKGGGRPPWYAGMGKNYEPGTGRHTRTRPLS